MDLNYLMFTTLAFIMTLLGVVLIYITNKNQRLLETPLSKNYALLGYLLLFISLVFWLKVLTPAAAFFMWLMTLMLAFISTPLLTLPLTKHRG